MKKFLAVLLSIVLVGTLSSIFVMAEDVSEESVDGFVFSINEIDGSIKGEDGVIATSAEAVKDANFKYTIVIPCEKVADNLYKVKADGALGDDVLSTLTLAAGDIAIGIHSASSEMDQIETYKNVPQKLAALKVKTGMYFTLEGIDLAAKTAVKATATVYEADPRSSESSAEESSAEESSEIVPDYTDITGDLVENPSYLLEVSAPDTYKVGDTINVTITLKNVTDEVGLDLIHFLLHYDATRVEPVIVNNAAKGNVEMNSFLTTSPDSEIWESISKLEADKSQYDLSFLTTMPDLSAKDDGSIVVVVPFKVKATATGSIAFQVPHKSSDALGQNIDLTLNGNAGLAVAELATAEESSATISDTSTPKTGDAGTIAIALVAVLALAGASTIAIKKRSR